MKPAFALYLSSQSISLLHRAADGWRLVGEIATDVADLPGAMADLRAQARLLAPDRATCKIVIPDELIRYMSTETGFFKGEARVAMAHAALQGATPYDLSELAVDLSFGGTRTMIAAVALETLQEAESFALEHGFEPLSFVAAPEPEEFDREPFFGPTRSVDPALEIEPDISPVRAVGPVIDSPRRPARTAAAPPTRPAAKTAPSRMSSPDPATPPERAAAPMTSGSGKPAPQGAENPLASGLSADKTAGAGSFAARQGQTITGKRRHPGLALTLGLLGILATVAIWATSFPGNEADEVDVAVQPVPPPTAALQAPPDSPIPKTRTAASRPAPDSEPRQDPAAQAAQRESALTEGTPTSVVEIWQDTPQAPPAPEASGLEGLYEVTIDARDLSRDAVALPPSTGFAQDQPPELVSSPAAAGTAIVLDADGLVTPTREGTVNPDGIRVYLGRPAIVPPPTPTRFEIEPPGEAEQLQNRLAGLLPRARPADLIEQNERSRLGGLSLDELAGKQPKTRPRSIKADAEVDETPTAQAVVASRHPDMRPRNFSATVQERRTARSSPSTRAASLVPATPPKQVTPRVPSSASVSRRATLDNAIGLNRLNLIGVYGTTADRRALVRLPSGRYRKVKVGDKVDGGRVLAIGASELRLQRGGRNLTLNIPDG